MRRSLVIVLAIIVVLAVAWCGAWFWLAGWADRNAERVLAEIGKRGVSVECRQRRAIGFPFALKIACADTAVTEPRSGTEAELGGVAAGVSVFAPRTARIDLGSPVALKSPRLPEPVSFRWNDAGINVGIGMTGPRSVGFDGSGFAGEIALPGLPKTSLAAATAGGSVAPTEDGGTDLTLAFTGLSLSAGGTAYPAFDGRLSAQLPVPPRDLLAGRAALQAPFAVRAVHLTLTSGAARLQIAGAVSIDPEGVIDGTVALRVAGAEALPAFIATLPPDKQKAGNAAVGAIMAFGKPAKLDGAPASELTIKIDHGKAKVGPVEVRVPKLPL
jgi:hypothetical protein